MIFDMWCISSVSINSCDIVGIFSNAVNALQQSLWLVGISVQGIKGNRMV